MNISRWLINMIDYNYETYEKEMKERSEKIKARRPQSVRSWAAPQYRNPFDYSDTDSETVIFYIVFYCQLHAVKTKY